MLLYIITILGNILSFYTVKHIIKSNDYISLLESGQVKVTTFFSIKRMIKINVIFYSYLNICLRYEASILQWCNLSQCISAYIAKLKLIFNLKLIRLVCISSNFLKCWRCFWLSFCASNTEIFLRFKQLYIMKTVHYNDELKEKLIT